MQILPGKIQELPVFDENDKTYLLGSEEFSIALPKYEVPYGTTYAEGESVKVFTFFDENSELAATLQLPEIEVGQVGVFRVKNVNDIGAFINIGTKRDIIIPNRDQREPIEMGRMVLITLQVDFVNRRLFASNKLSTYIKNYDVEGQYERGEEVDLMIGEKIEIGRRVVVNGKHMGALFRQEMITNVHEGQKIKGYIRKVEGKDITVSLMKEGFELLEDGKQKLMNYLEMNNGYARLNDDTDAEEIKIRLRMSKKTFKKVAGMLYKEGKVLLTKFGVKINKTGEIPTEMPEVWKERDEVRESRTKLKKGSSVARNTGDPVEELKKEAMREIKRAKRDAERGYSTGENNYSDRPPRRDNDGERSSYGDRPPRRSNDGERSSYGDRPPRRSNDGERSSYSDRPPRRSNDGERSSYGDRPPRRSNDSERSSYGDRPPRRSNDGERSSYGDRPQRRSNDSERSSYGDRPQRRSNDGERSSYGDRPPRRSNDGERSSYSDRPRRSNDGERSSYSDRPRRSNDGERSSYGERRGFSNRESSDDRKPRSNGRRDNRETKPKIKGSTPPKKKPSSDKNKGARKKKK